MSLVLKPTVGNIINLWFGVDTPLRQHKIKFNPEVWVACQNVSQEFTPPSKIQQADRYRTADKIAFAKAVQFELLRRGTSIARKVYTKAHPMEF